MMRLKHLRSYEYDLPFTERLKRWHGYRVIHDAGPIFWTLSFVWWIPGLQWLWRLRCRNVGWRLERHNRRIVAKSPNLYNWGR